MAHVHPTAVITGDVQLADEVVVGPYCVLAGRIRIGPGTQLVSHVHLHGPLWLGANNVCYPGSCLGFAPQDLKFDSSKEGAGTCVGDANIFREHVTIHRATREDRPTGIGHRNYWMVGSHAGHDVQVGSDCLIANGVMFGGHAAVGDRVVVGGNVGVHQFVRIGRGAMVGGGAGLSLDLCPFFMLPETNKASSVNVVGMRRAGMSRQDIDTVRWCHRVICRMSLIRSTLLETLGERGSSPLVREYIEFVATAKRGLATRRGRRIGEAGEHAASEP